MACRRGARSLRDSHRSLAHRAIPRRSAQWLAKPTSPRTYSYQSEPHLYVRLRTIIVYLTGGAMCRYRERTARSSSARRHQHASAPTPTPQWCHRSRPREYRRAPHWHTPPKCTPWRFVSQASTHAQGRRTAGRCVSERASKRMNDEQAMASIASASPSPSPILSVRQVART